MKSFALALLLVLSIGLQANESVAEIPFKIHRGHIYIQASINGSEPLNVVFDTGAAGNVLNQSKAESLGLKFGGQQSVSGANGQVTIRISEDNDLKIADEINMKNQTFYLTDISHLQDDDLPIDAIIGGNVLFRFVVEIDFEQQLIKLFNFRGYNAPNSFKEHKIQLYPYQIPIIEGTYVLKDGKSRTGSYLVDSGAALTISMNTPVVRKEKLLEKVSPNYEYLGKALGNESVELIGRLPKYQVLGEEFTAMPIRMSTTKNGVSSYDNVDGILGLQILKRFNLIFNYRKGQMYTKKNNSFDKAWRENRTGLNVIKKKSLLEVIGVVPKSAADISQIQIGDLIISVDGKEGLSYDEFDMYMNEVKDSATIVIQRKDKKIQVKLKPFKLI